MAKRKVYIVDANKNLVEKIYDFKYYSGFAISQKQKSVISLHEEIKKDGYKNLIEISSKSLCELGIKLSAFNLKVNLNGKFISVENIFQASKVFVNGGPYIDILNKTPLEAKKDIRLKSSGNLIAFRFNDKDYPIEPSTLFYDFIYCLALYRNINLANEIIKYDVFTDIEFNHEKSLNCQAHSVALFVALYRNNELEEAMKSFDNFKLYQAKY